MSPRPLIFVSAVSRELRSARQLVANTLTFLGYEPIWQDIFNTESGDLRGMLRQKLDPCKGLVQLVGQCYGQEPPTPDEQFGRVSYSQYEALYARSRGKKVWYLFMDEHFPTDYCEGESEELRQLQLIYRNQVRSNAQIFHPLATTDALEARVLKLRDDLTRLRRGVKQWAVGVAVLLILIAAMAVWLVRNQIQMRAEWRQAMMDYPQREARVRASQPARDPAEVEQLTYAQLGSEHGVSPDTLRTKVPQLAQELRSDVSIGTYERANANYVAKDYAQAERLALQAATEAQATKPANLRKVVAALELAGLSAQAQVQYDRAMQHLREAERFTNRNHNLKEWVTLQHDIAYLLVVQGKYADAEGYLRQVIEVRSRALGPEDADTLDSRHRLIYVLSREGKLTEAEAEARQVLDLRQHTLGPEDPDTLDTRYYLGDVLMNEGKVQEAEALYRELIRLDEKLLGTEHPRTIAARLSLAIVLGEEGRLAEAETLYREVISLDIKEFGARHPNTFNARQDLATALQEDGKYSEAEVEYREIIRLDSLVVGPEHPDTLICRNNLAQLLDEEEKFAEAESECRQILPAEQKAFGTDHEVTLNTRANLALALIGEGKFTEAETEYRDVMPRMETKLGFEHPDTLMYAQKLVNGLANQGKESEARGLAAEIEQRALRILGPANPLTRKFAQLGAEFGEHK